MNCDVSFHKRQHHDSRSSHTKSVPNCCSHSHRKTKTLVSLQQHPSPCMLTSSTRCLIFTCIIPYKYTLPHPLIIHHQIQTSLIMVISRSPVLLLALTLFLSSAFLSFGFYLKEESFSKLIAIYPETPRRQFEQCQQECWEEQGERRQQQCQHKCQKQYERRSEEEEESPRMKYEHCQRECQEELGERRQQECQQRCQKHYERRPEEEEESPRRKFEQCQRECQEELGYKRQQQCQRRCEKQYQRRPEEEEEEPEDPRLRFERCQERCRSKHEGRRVEHQQCQTRCQMEYEERQTGESHHRNPQRQRNNPFYFHSRTFQSKFKSQHGSLRVLPKFTQKSPLLRGIKNYRFSVMEVNPNTFVVPHHCDSKAILVVVRGNQNPIE